MCELVLHSIIEDEKKKRSINEMFGDDDSEEETLTQPSVPITADASGYVVVDDTTHCIT